MPSVKDGDSWYAGSEYAWKGNLTAIFDAFKQAYDKKKDANGEWAVNLAVYTTTASASNPTNPWLWRLAQLFNFGPSPAYACVNYGHIKIKGIIPAKVKEVNYKEDCYPISDCQTSNNVKITVQADYNIKLVK